MKVFDSSIDAKEFISTNLKLIPDQAFASVLRDIIFSGNTDWHRAAMSISKWMPETTSN